MHRLRHFGACMRADGHRLRAVQRMIDIPRAPGDNRETHDKQLAVSRMHGLADAHWIRENNEIARYSQARQVFVKIARI